MVGMYFSLLGELVLPHRKRAIARRGSDQLNGLLANDNAIPDAAAPADNGILNADNGPQPVPEAMNAIPYAAVPADNGALNADNGPQPVPEVMNAIPYAAVPADNGALNADNGPQPVPEVMNAIPYAVVPADNGALNADNGTHPVSEVMNAIPYAAVAADNGALNADNSTHPVPEVMDAIPYAAAPADNGALNADNGTHPVPEVTDAIPYGAVPADNGALNADNGTHPVPHPVPELPPSAPSVPENNNTYKMIKAKEVGAISSSGSLQEIHVNREETDVCDEQDNITLADRRKMLLARRALVLTNPLEQSDSVGMSKHGVVIALFALGNEPNFGKKRTSEKRSMKRALKLKPLDNNGTRPRNLLGYNHVALAKTEPVLEDDFLDKMILRDRMNMKSSQEVFTVNVCESLCGRFIPDNAKGGRNARKSRKTWTDSVETALEEDAPGLLKVLIEKGVTVDEIKLYGETDNEEASDDSPLEESFSELEAVISKLFAQKTSLLKLEPLKYAKGEKVSYCLACLFSLIEQARYLQFRKWPVEWGWCRDLQSFIFVFERHHRIVLERPEYGYATYFFELLESLPIAWQIKRLVTAMRLTSCSRITLIENKALVVGEDLSKGEAKVLMEYGWLPDTGLGTMLNYCDRVIHDRHERDPSEWKSKIGKLLVDGYNGGTIVSDSIPKKAEEYNFPQNQPLKLEPAEEYNHSQNQPLKLELV